MPQALHPGYAMWPLWRLILFRFFFIYFFLQITPFFFLQYAPGAYSVLQYYFLFTDWLATLANNHIFHIAKVLVPVNGSGDTSMGWAQQALYLLLAMLGCIIWSLADRRKSYRDLNYALCLLVRYFVAFTALQYGIIKLFAQQMSFPNLSQLATPLGDLLPMRLSWLFIGYSEPYQIFSGVMEIIAGLLLVYRRTSSFGALVATGVFLNVMMLNLSYDIPVKIFSINLAVMSIFLLMNEAPRFINFFILNAPAPASSLYDITLPNRWMRIGRIVLKTLFLILSVGMMFYTSWEQKNWQATANKAAGPLRPGVYAVQRFELDGKDIAPSVTDSLRWADFILEEGTLGSIKTADTLFRQRYKRGYFVYDIDSKKQLITMRKSQDDSIHVINLTYSAAPKGTIQLSGDYHNKKLIVELHKINRHFQLAEKQFHWLSEANR